MRLPFFVGGILLSLVGLWVGAYAVHKTWDTWMNYPTFLTSMTVVVAGFILVGVGTNRKPNR